MDTHDRNLFLMMFMAAALVSLNFFAVITGVADGFYNQSELISPLEKCEVCNATGLVTIRANFADVPVIDRTDEGPRG